MHHHVWVKSVHSRVADMQKSPQGKRWGQTEFLPTSDPSFCIGCWFFSFALARLPAESKKHNPRNRYNSVQTNTSDLICGWLTFAHTFQLLNLTFVQTQVYKWKVRAKEGAKYAARFDSGHARTRERERKTSTKRSGGKPSRSREGIFRASKIWHSNTP